MSKYKLGSHFVVWLQGEQKRLTCELLDLFREVCDALHPVSAALFQDELELV